MNRYPNTKLLLYDGSPFVMKISDSMVELGMERTRDEGIIRAHLSDAMLGQTIEESSQIHFQLLLSALRLGQLKDFDFDLIKLDEYISGFMTPLNLAKFALNLRVEGYMALANKLDVGNPSHPEYNEYIKRNMVAASQQGDVRDIELFFNFARENPYIDTLNYYLGIEAAFKAIYELSVRISIKERSSKRA